MYEKISIIVPIYNVEQYLERCVNSIIKQTYKNLDIILIDDGSTDGSPAICDRYEKSEERIRVLHQVNQGLSAARNSGIEIANGEYFCFVDSDDYVAEDLIEKLYSMLLEQGADIAICNFVSFYEKFAGDIPKNETKIDILSSYEILQMLHQVTQDKFVNTVVAWGKLYKRSLFANLRFPVGRYCEDISVIYKLYDLATNIVCSSEVLYFYYRNNSNSITYHTNHKFYNDLILAYVEQLEYLYQNNYMEIVPLLKKKLMYWLLEYYKSLDTRSYKKMRKEVMHQYRVLFRSIRMRLMEPMYICFYYFPKIYIRIRS